MFEQCLATLGTLRSGLTIQQVRRFGVPNRFHRPMQMSLLVPDLHGPWHPLLLFLFLFCIPASSFSISGDAFGSSGLLFLVARPGATSSIQPSSKTCGRHTYQAQTLETGVNTLAHTQYIYIHIVLCIYIYLCRYMYIYILYSDILQYPFLSNIFPVDSQIFPSCEVIDIKSMNLWTA